MNGIIDLERLRETAQQPDKMLGRFRERFVLAREHAETGQALADFERQHHEQFAPHVIAHDGLGQHGHGVETFEQLQRGEDRGRFGEIHRRGETGAREFAFEQFARGTRDGLGDPRPVHQFGKRDVLMARERMARAHDQHERFARERLEAEIVVLQRRGETAEREIDVAPMQQLYDLVARFAEDAHVQQRALGLEHGNGMREQIGRSAHDGAHGQLAVTAAPLDVEIFGETREVGERAARVGERDDAERRGLHAACIAFEKAKAKGFFDVAEHAARAGLRHVDDVGGLMHVACVVERDEQGQMFELESVDERDDGSVMVHGSCDPV
ncbi:hypothetical protein PT2222_30243 [Paraburkholderia tropica]